MTDKTSLNLSKNLKFYMDKHKLNNKELAEKLGVSDSSVGKWLLMKAVPRMGIIEQMAIIFDINKSDLLEDKDEQIIPDYFETKEDAIEYLMNQKVIAANTGIDISKYSEDEIVQFTNRLLDYARFLDNDKKKMD